MKKTFTKLLSVFLCILMVVYLLPTSVYVSAIEHISDMIKPSGNAETSIEKDVYPLGEDISLRTENAKYIRMSDGSYYVATYETAVHYLDENGKWEEIDNTLVSSAAEDDNDFSGVATSKGKLNIKFANNSSSSKLMEIKEENYKVSFHLVGANKTKAATIVNPEEHDENATSLDRLTIVKRGISKVLYSDILDGVDLEYIVIGNKIKENIIIKDKADIYQYEFDMKLNKLTPELIEDGTIILKDEKTEKVCYVMSLPFMVDANGEYSDSVSYSLIQIKNKEYRITVTADSDWMNDESRAFPVTIDPPINSYSENAIDTWVREDEPTSVHGSYTYAYLGYASQNSYRYYWKLNSLPSIPQNSIITSATFSVYQSSLSLYQNDSEYVPVGAFEVLGSWNGNMTWNNQPSYNTSVIDYENISVNTNNSYIDFDITRVAKKWYYGSANNGISLCTIPERASAGSAYATIYTSDQSSLRPVFTMTYRDSKGLEDYYTYHSQSIGRAGTGYINDYTSKLTLVRPDIVSDSTILPFTLSHIYNDGYAGQMFSEGNIHTADFSAMTMGYGWKLNVQETVVSVNIGGQIYYVYNDSDGTEHYFKNENGVYVDEDGLGLTLTFSGTQYTITDKQDNRKVFINGILSKIIDANGNTIKMVYNGANGNPLAIGSRLQRIIRWNVGYQTESTADIIATFYYDTLGRLISIEDLIGRITSYSYTGNLLTSITGPDGYQAQYTYSNNILTFAYDSEAKYGMNYSLFTYSSSSYNWKSARNVSEYYTSGTSKVFGQEIQIENYSGKRTVYTDYGKDNAIGTSDDIITTYTFDNEGRTVGAYSNDGNYKKVYGASNSVFDERDNLTSKNKNRISSSSITGVLSNNLLLNGSFENSHSWGSYGNNVYLSTTKAHTGLYSVVLSSTSIYSSEIRYYQQSPFLTYDKEYTVSAYVDVSALGSASETGGVYLKASCGGETYIGQKLNVNLTSGLSDKWQRISLTFTPELGGQFDISVCLQGAVGTVYVDDVQLEESAAPSSYNLAQDVSAWTRSSAFCTLTTYSNEHGSREALMFLGAPGRDVLAQHIIPINKSAKTTFLLSAWAMGYSVPIKDNETFSLIATIRYTDNTSESAVVPFQTEIWGEEQFISGIVVPSKANENKTIKDIVLTISYKDNCNSAYVYDISLVEEEVQTYSYDANGNLVAANQTDNSTITSYYNDINNLISHGQNNQNYTYTYKTGGNKHLLDTVTNNGITMSFSYDSAGNVSGTTVTGISTSWYLSSNSYYTSDGNRISSSYDTNGTSASYTYNNRNLLTAVTNANNVATRYDYDENTDRTKISYISGIISVNYNYVNGVLDNIVRGGYIDGNSIKQNQTYKFNYDGFGNVTSVSVGNYTLVSYTYAAKNGHLTKTTYGNGTYIENTYDELDRIVEVKINGVVKYKYSYNGNGDLYSVEDIDNNTTYCYNYDSLDRLISSYQKTGNIVSLLTNYEYDDQNRVSVYHCGLAGAVGGTLGQTYSYTYNAYDGNLTSISVSADNISGDLLNYSYDGLKRLSGKSVVGQYRTLTQEYNYNTIAGNRTSTLVSGITWKLQGTTELSYTYSYDALGNITAVYKNGAYLAEYTYDDQGQLTSEKMYDQGLYYIYNYDTYGNIRTIEKKDLWTDEYIIVESHEYNNMVWLDRMTSCNGTAITYDGIGNPLSYNNGTNFYDFTWKNGRELATSYRGDVTTSYKYGADGLRTQKIYGGTTYNYYYSDGNLVRQTWGSHYMDFLYDETGTVYSFVYDGTQYYYVKNLQGDVTQIRSVYGTVLVEYSYDAWGNVLSISGMYANTLGQDNPIRYRGYYYDFETDFYYLQSRYYDPAMGRFINADDVNMLNDSEELLGYNLYTYCINNPVNLTDDTGTLPKWAKKLIVGVAVIAACAIVTVATGGAGAGVAGFIASGALKGAVIGAATGATVGAVTGAVTHRVSTGSWEGAGMAALESAADGFMTGAISGAVTGAASNGFKVAQAAKNWDAGTYKSGFKSMSNHYQRKVVQQGLSKGNNVVNYTKTATSFAQKNASAFSLHRGGGNLQHVWTLGSGFGAGPNGLYTSSGKIVSFSYYFRP